MTNKICRTNISLYLVPLYTFCTYFFKSNENLYFMLIALLQLSTYFDILPKSWSPTGPFSTAVPLLITFLAEIVKDVYIWIKKWMQDRRENLRVYPLISGTKFCENLAFGDILYLKEGEICPVDGIIIDNPDVNSYVKISHALLSGESHEIFLSKVDKTKNIQNYLPKSNYKVIIRDYMPKDYHNINAVIEFIDGTITEITGENFIVHRTVLKSCAYVMAIGVGATRKTLENKVNDEKEQTRSSRLDQFVGKLYAECFNKAVIILHFFIDNYAYRNRRHL